MENLNRKYPKKTENIKEYYKEYYIKKKQEKPVKFKSEKPEEIQYFNCDICSSSCKLSNKAQHERSKKHIDALNN